MELIEDGIASLDGYLRLVESRKASRPVLRMVVTAVGEHAYARKDGIIVCPIRCLMP